MTLATSAWGHDGLTYTGKDMRQLVAAVAPDNGVVNTGDFLVAAQASPNATVQVAAGQMIVPATGAGLFGSYAVWNDASINSGTFAPTSTNGRWDYLILRVTSGVPALEIVQGTAAASPAAPAITGDNYEPLALVKLPGSTTNVTNAMITDARNQVVPAAMAWTSYTPTWRSTSSQPVLNNGTLTGRYSKTGRVVQFAIYLGIGSTTNGGTGGYSFDLPFSATTSITEQPVTAKMYVVSQAVNYNGFGYIAAGATVVVAYMPQSSTNTTLLNARNSTTGAVSEGIPNVSGGYPLTSGANLVIAGAYESAT